MIKNKKSKVHSSKDIKWSEGEPPKLGMKFNKKKQNQNDFKMPETLQNYIEIPTYIISLRKEVNATEMPECLKNLKLSEFVEVCLFFDRVPRIKF